MILYHGSNVQVSTPKILVTNRMLDFGAGFYTTSNRQQAVKWAKTSGAASGRFRNPHVARTHLYRIDLRRADRRSAPLQYAATGICVFYKLHLHHDSDGAGLPQCDHVESFYIRSELFAASGLRCQRSRL